jgi:hypothetical protein
MGLSRLFKQPAEDRLFDFDFSGKMRTGETVATVSVTATPSGLTIGSTAFSGQIAQVRISGGMTGTDYKMTCTVTTNQSNTLELDGWLRVINE